MLIYVDSDNRISGTSHDFIFNIRDLELKKYKFFNLVNVSVPKSYYYLNGSDGFYIQEENIATGTIAEYYIVPPRGNYTLKGLLAETNALLSALIGIAHYTYTISYDGPEKVQIGKFKITAAAYDESIYETTIYTSKPQIARAYGLDLDAVEFFDSSGVYISTSIIQLSYESLLLHSSLIRGNNTNNDVIALMNTRNTPDFSYIQYENIHDSILNEINPSPLVRFYITDIDNNIINLNNVQVNLTLNLVEEDLDKKEELRILRKIENYILMKASEAKNNILEQDL